MGDIRGQQRAPVMLEPCNQADPPRPAAHLVPGQPDAVGRSERRLALVLGQIFRRKDEFLFRLRMLRIGLVVIEGVHDQVAVDEHRPVLVLAEEQKAAAEAAGRGMARLVQRGVGPDGFDAFGGLRLRFLRIQHLLEIALLQTRAAAESARDEQRGGRGWNEPAAHTKGTGCSLVGARSATDEQVHSTFLLCHQGVSLGGDRGRKSLDRCRDGAAGTSSSNNMRFPGVACGIASAGAGSRAGGANSGGLG